MVFSRFLEEMKVASLLSLHCARLHEPTACKVKDRADRSLVERSRTLDRTLTTRLTGWLYSLVVKALRS